MFALVRLPSTNWASRSIHLSMGSGLHTSTTQRAMVTIRTHAHSRPHARVYAFSSNQSNFVIGRGTNSSALHVSTTAENDELFTVYRIKYLYTLYQAPSPISAHSSLVQGTLFFLYKRQLFSIQPKCS